MNQRKYFRKIYQVFIFVIVLGSLIPAGCGAPTSSRGSGIYFDNKGLPRSNYYVGGGFNIEWNTQHNGTAYLVEENKGIIIEMKLLKSGDKYEFSPDPEILKEIFGVEISELKISLYFIPGI